MVCLMAQRCGIRQQQEKLMYRVAICDDNAADAQQVYEMARGILREYRIEADFSLFYSSCDLLADWESRQPRYDLLMLEVLTKEIDGIELARRMRMQACCAKIIYITVCPDYAIHGYKVSASDYLLKPIDRDSLAASIGRVISQNRAILVETEGAMKTILASQILFAEANGHYVTLQTGGRNLPIRIRATLNELQQNLGLEQFARCHKGYLINLAYVQEIRARQILLSGGTVVPLGRQYRGALLKHMAVYSQCFHMISSLHAQEAACQPAPIRRGAP